MTTVIEKCDCHSYNGDFGEEKEHQLKPAEFMHSKKEFICIDACISNVIQALWDAKVHTIGSCCGHNKQNPSIVISDKNQSELADIIIKLHDDKNRQWDVLCWILTKTNKVEK